MPDITMCHGTSAPACADCFRRTATPSDWVQAYFTIAPADAEGNCEYRLPPREVKP